MKKITVLVFALILAACATTGTASKENTVNPSRTKYIMSSTTKNIEGVYDSETDTFTFGRDLSEIKKYATSDLLMQLKRSYNSIKMEMNAGDLKFILVEGRLDDRISTTYTNNKPAYVLVFKDLSQNNRVDITFNQYEKDFFDKVRPGDFVQAVCYKKSLKSDYLYGEIWKSTIDFSGCVPIFPKK
ncbi:hypothetical protein Dip510_000061 [Elusimicrobium posterum]|uniref:hypothetical protein n=1 Tax=Elusimicrobium posterum TaxID=3116653 RepID=UPI003C76350F